MSEVAGVVAADAALRALLATPVSGSSAELVDGLRGLQRLRNLVAAAETQLLAGIEDARRAGGFGTAQVLDVLVDALPVTVTEARARLRRAEAVTPGRTLTGEPLGPIAPMLAAAWVDGAVSERHTDTFIGVLDRIPSWCDAATVQIVEKALVEACPHETPPVVATMGEHLLARLDQDGPEPRDPEPRRASRRRDGGIRWTFDTDVAGDAALQAVLDPLAAPCPAEDGRLDPRSHTQRQHDGLLEALQRLLRSGSCRRPAGSRPQCWSPAP